MNSGLKQVLEFMLNNLAKDGSRPWPQLKAELVAAGLDGSTLDAHQIDILALFVAILASPQQDSPRSHLPLQRQCRNPPLKPRPPAPFDASNLSVPSPSSFRRTTSCNTQLDAIPNDAPEEGWILLEEETGKRGRLAITFGPEPENKIGTHMIDRYREQLRPRVRNGVINLVCRLDSHPRRTYGIEFQIEESQDFDIQLGTYWRGDRPKEVQSDNGGTTRAYRDSRGVNDLASSQSAPPIDCNGTTGNSDQFSRLSSQISPEFLARFVKELHIPENSRPKPRIRRGQDKEAGLDTDPGHDRPRIKRDVRIRVPRQSSRDSPLEEGPRSQGGGGDDFFACSKDSDASMSQASIFDVDIDQGNESEPSDFSSSQSASDDSAARLLRLVRGY